jgi:uncharacterized protein (TIGR04255 family)
MYWDILKYKLLVDNTITMEINGCHVIPARTHHAVQAAMFVLELPAQISSEILKASLAHYEQSVLLKELFPEKTQSLGVSIDLSTNTVTSTQSDNIQGLTFQRNSAEGQPELIFSIQGNQLAYTCNVYTRWSEVFNQAKEILNQFIPLICPVPGVAVIGLQYVDEFFVTGNLNEFNSAIVFSEDTKRLPLSVFHEKDFWHNHSGWFENAENDGRILNNLNISYYPQQHDKNAIQLISAHRYMFKTPISDKDLLENTIQDIFEKLHAGNKTMFKEILNIETSRSISL